MMKYIKRMKFLNKLKLKYPKKYQFLHEIVDITRHKEVMILPSYLAFFILLSFIPIFTLIFEVIFLTINNSSEVLELLYEILPSHVYTITVKLVAHNSSYFSILTLSNLILLYLASRVYFSFYQSYLIIFEVEVKPHFIKDKIIALVNTLLLIILIFLLSILTVFNQFLYQIVELTLSSRPVIYFIFNYLNFALTIIVVSAIVTFMMYSIPDIRQTVKDVIYGALFVTFGWLLVSYGFKIYSDNFANYQTVYKTFTSVIVFVTWIYFISYVFIIGIIINKAKSNITTHELKEQIKTNNEYTEGSEYS